MKPIKLDDCKKCVKDFNKPLCDDSGQCPFKDLVGVIVE
jgi:hypothetical protein